MGWYVVLNMYMVALDLVCAGYSLGGTSLPENQLAPYIQQAVDQVRTAIYIV